MFSIIDINQSMIENNRLIESIIDINQSMIDQTIDSIIDIQSFID